MRENPERILRIVCLGLAMLFIFQLVRIAIQKDPLESLSITSASAAELVVPDVPVNNPVTNQVTKARPGQRAPTKQVILPPVIQARVDRITQSEILGMVVRPLPMALLGIAGREAFLRAPNGQVGLLREGEELGGVKLLRIGTNRVLIEHEKEQKELTVFAGLGGETLLPKGKATPQ